MKALLLWTTLPAIFFLAMSVNGASFDCAKGSSFAERTICTDRRLSELDDKLALAYKNALAKAAEPAAVRASQRYWLQLIRNRCQDSECLRGAYEARLAEFASPVRAEPTTTIEVTVLPNQEGNCGNGMGGLDARYKNQLVDILFGFHGSGPNRVRHSITVTKHGSDTGLGEICGWSNEVAPVSGHNILVFGTWDAKSRQSLCRGNINGKVPCFEAYKITILDKE